MNALERLLYDRYHTVDGDLVVFRCTECGHSSFSVGALHAHAEQHRDIAIDPFGLVVPPWRLANVEALWELTEIVAVDGEETVEPTEVEGL